MKKLFFGAIIALTTATPALADTTIDEAFKTPYMELDHYVLEEFAYNNKATFITWEDDDYRIVSIYNDEIQKVKTFNINNGEHGRTYRVIKERKATAEGVYNGEWVEYTEEDYLPGGGTSIKYYNTSNGRFEDYRIFYTQTLFNSDEKYEYMQNVFGEYKTTVTERDRDGDGDTDYIETEYSGIQIGFDVKNEDGDIVCSLRPRLPEGYTVRSDYPELLKINGKIYLILVSYKKDDYDAQEEFSFFLITPGESSVQQVGEPIRTSVFPTMPRRDEMVTVELDDAADAQREIVVTNAQGQTVYKQRVAQGEKRVQINSGRLSHGLNIVTVKGDNSQQSCKVIVR